MTVFYTNTNAPGEIVEREERSARLDALPNWESHASREAAQDASRPHAPTGLAVSDGILHRPGMAPRRPSIVAPDGTVPAPLPVLAAGDAPEGAPEGYLDGEQTGQGDDEPDGGAPVARPKDSASAADWERYAVSRGMTAEAAQKATKAQLIERYGNA